MGRKFKFSAQDSDLEYFLSRVKLSDKKLPLCMVCGIDFIVTGSDLADNLTKLTVHLKLSNY